MRRFAILVLPLVGCATPGARYFENEARGCDDVRAARPYADAHPEVTPDARAQLDVDLAQCEAEAGHADAMPALLDEAQKLDPHVSGDADAERAALLYDKDPAAARELFTKAVGEGFKDLEQVLDGPEFAKLAADPELEHTLVSLAASEEPVEPRVRALATKLKQQPVTPVVVEANPAYGMNTFALWRGRVVESHYDDGNDETTILLEELVEHAHASGGEEAHQHYETIWTPQYGFVKQPHDHVHADAEAHSEYEATGRYFGLRTKGFQRELVEAPDLEIVGYYVGRSPFTYKNQEGEAATLEVVRAVPFNSGVHLGTPVAHE